MPHPKRPAVTLEHAERVRRATTRTSNDAPPRPQRAPIDIWPHTNRILPWLIAAFMVMVYWVPFDSVSLPISLPINSDLDRFVIGLLVLTWLVVWLTAPAGTIVFRRGPLNLGIYLFLAAAFASLIVNVHQLAWDGELTLALKELSLIISYLAAYVVIATSVKPEEITNYFKLLVGLAVVTAIGTVLEYTSGFNIFFWAARTFLVGTNVASQAAGATSVGGPGARPSITGPALHGLADVTLIATAVPFCICFASSASTRRARVLWWIAIVVLIAGCIATGRKTSLVVIALSFVILAIYDRRRYARYLLAPVLAVLALLVIAPNSINGLLFQVSNASGSTSTTARLADFAAVLPDVTSHFLIGRGYGSFDPFKYRILDDQMLGWLVSVGLLGAVAYAVMVLAVVPTVHRAARHPASLQDRLMQAVAAASVGYFVTNFLYDTFGFRQAPYTFFIVAALGIAHSGETRHHLASLRSGHTTVARDPAPHTDTSPDFGTIGAPASEITMTSMVEDPPGPFFDAIEADESAGLTQTPQLAGATFSGVRWMSVGRLLAESSNFVTLIVLSRILTPSQYGIATLSLILGTVAIGWSSEGFGNPLVQSSTIDKDAVGTANALCWLSSAALSAAIFFIGPGLVALVFGDAIRPLVREASLCFLFAGAGAVPMALIQRELNFRWLAIADSSSTIAGSIISIVLALLGAGPSSLVIGIVATQLINSLILLPKAGWPGFRWSRSAARANSRYGIPATAASLLSIVFGNEDSVIVGARLDTAALGFYYRAFTLGVSYQRRASQIILRLLLPVLSRSTDVAHMASMRRRITRMQCSVMFLPLSLLIVSAPMLVPDLLGQRWAPAVLPAQIMAVAGMIGCLIDGSTQLLLAAGRPASLMKASLLLCVLYGGAIYVGASYGVTGAALGATGVYVVWLVFVYHFQIARVVHEPLWRLLLDAAPGFGPAAVAVAGGLPIEDLLRAHVPGGVALLGSILAGTLLYLFGLAVLFPSAWRELRATARTVLNRRQAA